MARQGSLTLDPTVDRLTLLADERRATPGNRFWLRLRSERKALFGLIFVGSLILIGILGPAIVPYDPLADDYELFASPSWSHPLGTDSFGRDLLSRVIVGTRVSLSVGLLATLSAMVVGGLLGLVAGYYGGWLDSLIMRFIDLL